MQRKRIWAAASQIIAITLAAVLPVNSQPPEVKSYQETAQKLFRMALAENQAIRILEQIVSAGPRLSGSPGASAAVEIARQLMQDYGFDDVHLEPVEVPRWVRGNVEKAMIVNSNTLGTIPLSISALGGSPPTAHGGITAEVVEVHSLEEVEQLGETAKGKIIFFNRPMDPTDFNTFHAYGKAADQRVRGPAEAAKVGATAALVRSLTTRLDDVPHTGATIFREDEQAIPSAAVSTAGANTLSRLLKQENNVRVHLELSCRQLADVLSTNVVGQITGSQYPEEIILVGGHLDAWDVGQGAHDDGAGCAHAIEALRLIRSAGLKPKRTIRAVLFMNEENGSRGARAYPEAPQRHGEKHIVAIESDRGGFYPQGFYVGGDSVRFAKIARWSYLFAPIRANQFEPGGGGPDISPLGRKGTVTIGLNVQSARYFDYHHSANDAFDTVNERELELGAAATAILAYVLSEEGL